MGPQERQNARSSLDNKLNSLRNSEALVRPPRGWIRAIREALGMTTAQLGKRVGVSQPRAVQMEQGENDGSITLESLRRAARALDCELVYAFIPNQPLEALVRKRAQILASKHMRSVSHSMALEEQRVGERQEQQQLERLVEKLLAGRGSKLWEEATSD
ncbi:MAG: mobile mystery protein A [Gammaproteobacteria bacterium]|nr:mobile mystery protein A [Gammaproteobacteria bacterium]